MRRSQVVHVASNLDEHREFPITNRLASLRFPKRCLRIRSSTAIGNNALIEIGAVVGPRHLFLIMATCRERHQCRWYSEWAFQHDYGGVFSFGSNTNWG